MDEPFVVLNGDDVYVAKEGGKPALKEIIEVYNQTGKYVLGCSLVSDDVVDRYGVVVPNEVINERTVSVKGFKEKPKKGEQPSNLASLGRYLVLPNVYDNILKAKPSANGEVYFPEAIAMEIEKDNLLAFSLDAKYYDLGNKLEFIKCTIEMALKDNDIKDDLIDYLKSLNA